jgi:hypothetical protein
LVIVATIQGRRLKTEVEKGFGVKAICPELGGPEGTWRHTGRANSWHSPKGKWANIPTLDRGAWHGNANHRLPADAVQRLGKSCLFFLRARRARKSV